MRTPFLGLALAAVLATPLAASPGTASAQTYTIDHDHTSVLFFVNHLGFSNVQGEFGDVKGTFEFNMAKMADSKVDVTIATASIDTDVPALDQHLRGADFFDADKYPEIRFTSTGVTLTGPRTGKLTGDLTMHGVTRSVTLDVTFNKAGNHPFSKVWTAGFSARGFVNRSDFNIRYGLPVIGDTVDIRIELEGQAK